MSERRFKYEEEVRASPLNYDTWFDYIRLEESAGDIERTREVRPAGGAHGSGSRADPGSSCMLPSEYGNHAHACASQGSSHCPSMLSLTAHGPPCSVPTPSAGVRAGNRQRAARAGKALLAALHLLVDQVCAVRGAGGG